MTMIQYLSILRQLEPGIQFLAPAVAIVSALLKKTLLKSSHKFVLAALPFLLGSLLYALYRVLSTMSLTPLVGDLSATLSGGFACGSAATIYSAVYDRLTDRTEQERFSPVYPLLEGYVSESRRAEAAAELYEGSLALEGDALTEYLDKTLEKYVLDEITDSQRTALRILIEQFLLFLRKTT